MEFVSVGCKDVLPVKGPSGEGRGGIAVFAG